MTFRQFFPFSFSLGPFGQREKRKSIHIRPLFCRSLLLVENTHIYAQRDSEISAVGSVKRVDGETEKLMATTHTSRFAWCDAAPVDTARHPAAAAGGGDGRILHTIPSILPLCCLLHALQRQRSDGGTAERKERRSDCETNG
ncbi:hypothetical protein GPALN_014861 [Globodera pallida]|nr:hypothetical protein GPALN_014861 [Globodera pallida]